ncbi:family 43 glycosylhydrolase [Formosa sp. S-31]|uniref:family 43 glycosylhydrolase n=1 Tax=Formosa sp. S-31 TaxID=2790949 RepID=UPI003EB7A650
MNIMKFAFKLFFLSVTLIKVNAQYASKPLFRDPVFDGAADPTVIWNEAEQKWFMFYTNRRANMDKASGVEWVHGTKIGVAESTDDGNTWVYKGVCNIPYGEVDYSHWAPEVIAYDGVYHMYLTIVPGTFSDWKHPRYIAHFTSENLLDWEYQSKLNLATDKCIDACVFQLPNGVWRMYYNNEKDGKSMYYADSEDLYHWVDSGKKVVGDKGGEGPDVFEWQGKYWMIVDNWSGLGVYKSDDLEHWERQAQNILKEPGTGKDDQVMGGHPGIVVNKDRAFVFYFTHPGRTPENKGKDTYETRRSSIQVAELELVNGEIMCNRNKPVRVQLR